MAIGDTYTTGLKSFIENNANAGYIRTSSEITTSDIAAAVSQIIGNEYVKANQLAQVATSGNYNHLSNLPTLHRVASSGDYFDLINRPTFHEVATSGDYNKLINKPDIESRVDTEVNTLITTAINDLRTEIKGANVGTNYDTLAKLQGIKSEIIYLDVTAAPYNLTNFGTQSFSTNAKHALITKIETEYFLNKIIILEANNSNYIVTGIDYDNSNNIFISMFKILQNNFSEIKTSYEVDNEGLDYPTYIAAHIEYNLINDEIIYDITKTTSLFIHTTFQNPNNNRNLITEIFTALTDNGQIFNNFDTRISTCEAMFDNLTELANRVTLLESYHSSTEPEPEEQTEP